MAYLTLASLLFAASFGLISRHLAGVDPKFVAFARMGLALVLFLPFLRTTAMKGSARVRLVIIGAVQFGLMYVLYQQAYASLLGHEIALFTTLTPLHVVLLDGALQRKLERWSLFAAGLAVLSAVVLAWQRPDPSSFGVGFLLVQAANLCFAAGQVLYRHWIGRQSPHAKSFAWPYCGGALVAAVAFVLGGGGVPSLDASQWGVLAYLGLVPAGIGFYLWNVGATRVSTGTLSAANNLKAPLGVALALVLFQEPANMARLGLSSLLILVSLLAASRTRASRSPGQ